MGSTLSAREGIESGIRDIRVRFADIHTAHFSRTSHPKAIRTSLTNHHVIPSTHAFVLVLRGPLEGRAYGISAPSFVFHRPQRLSCSCFGTGFWPLRSLIMPPQHTNGCIVWYSFVLVLVLVLVLGSLGLQLWTSTSARSSNQPWGSVGDRRGDRAHDNPSGLHPLGCYYPSIGVAMNACLQHACI